MTALPVLKSNPGSLPTFPMSESERDAVARDLANAVRGEVRFDRHNRMLYATDASLYQVEPLGVVIPADIEDAVAAVEFCSKRSLPILPRGGGTSLAGQCTNRAVVIDFSAFCGKVLSINAEGRECFVEPGISVDDLNDALGRRTNLFFAPDPATSKHCNIGGAIGNNAAGSRSIRYGRTSESLLGVDVMLADGTRLTFDKGAALRDPRVRELTRRVADVILPIAPIIKERFPKTVRRNAGYALDMVLAAIEKDPANLSEVNLAHLVCGSEGTLAVTLGARLALHPKPKSKGLSVLGFSDLDEAIAAVIPILATGPSAVELLDDMVVGLASANAEYRRYVELMPLPADRKPLKAVLYVEYFSTYGPEEIRAKFEQLAKIMPGIARQDHTDAKAMLNAWKLRKAGEPLLHGVPGDRKPITFIEDNAIPVERLGEFVKRLRAIVTKHGTIAAYWAHASVGVLHVRPLIDIHDTADRKIMQAIAVETADLARELGGVMSGEHGDGRVRGPLLERFFGPEIMAAFRDIKTIFDPRNLLNPGNIVEPRPIESISQKLRVEPSIDRPTTFPSVHTSFNYDDQHGFEGAVEMCNGAGVCRKKTGGTMCPSYQATLDERHSTRGRGNALRLAISGQLGAPETPGGVWNDPGTIETLNLCLSCKACKTECPSNVDISRLKAEYTSQRYKAAGGPPLSAMMFGYVRTLNRLGSLTPGLANWMNRTPLVKWLLKKFAKIDPRRDIPAFARSLASDFRAEPANSKPRVALFGDCFTMFNEPGIGRATKIVYEALGYHITLADAGCCGRSFISTGLLPEAIDQVDATIERLRPLIDDERIEAILVAEPSCLSAIKDDWLQLNLQAPIALRKKLAAKCFLPEEFLARADHAAQLKAMCDDADGGRLLRPVVLHGHCHQKALWGAESSAKILREILGDDLKVLDTGCCGMAGSFGFTTDRYDLSMRIGELTLFPALRDAPHAEVCAPGTSCRHQIHDGAGRKAVHPIELIAERITGVPSKPE